ncbi:MAG: hypothetical protein F4128_10780 [Gammaproteobacteria bacterium]|nr:hypothetical protein [Gammaproteobacteria bacterium]
MSPVHIAAMVALMAMLAAAGFRFWQDRTEETALRADLEAVRALAVDYARHFCETSAALPASPESLAGAAARIGRSVPPVTDPDPWSIRLETRPGGAGLRALARYRAGTGDLANSVFSVMAGAETVSGQIEIPVPRGRSGNSAGFRWLMSDKAC